MDKRRRDKRKNIAKRSKRLRMASILSLVLILGTISLVLFLQYRYLHRSVDVKEASVTLSELSGGRIVDDLLDKNKYSRPGKELKRINGIVVHYTANPGTGAKANRNYFNNLPEINKKKGTKTYASSNFIIDIDGKILRVVPETEVAYASNDRNEDTLSIECCYLSEDGSFTEQTYDSLVWLVSVLCKVYKLNSEQIIRHYDVTGKNCPKYYVANEDKWLQFKVDVMKETEKKRN